MNRRMTITVLFTLSLLLSFALWQPEQHGKANAAALPFATLTVTNTNDSGAGSLRQAIADAASGDTIDFNLSNCPCTITLTSGELVINKNLIITGPGASQLTISGGNTSRVFFINPGAAGATTGPPATNPVVSISNLKIANGLAKGGNGGNAGCTGGGGGAAGMGGGIFINGGTVTLAAVAFDRNEAIGGNGGSSSAGQCTPAGGGGGVGGDSVSFDPTGGSGGSLGGNGGTSNNDGGEGAGGGGSPNACGPPSKGCAGGFGGGGGGGGCNNNAGAGGFGGGGGGGGYKLSIAPGGPANGGIGGAFGGNGADNIPGRGGVAGGGGAGLGGAIFLRAGSLNVSNSSFTNNLAMDGFGANNGQGKGGALFIHTGATANSSGNTYSANGATSAACTATDNGDLYGTLSGYSYTTTPPRLGFQQHPTDTTPATAISPAVIVRALNWCGNVYPVTLALGNNPSIATLGGTLNSDGANGIAIFSDLTVDKLGTGYTLTASSGNLTPVTSRAFDVTCPTITVTPAAGALSDGTAGSAYSQQFSQTGITGEVTWSINPPIPGLNIDSTGLLSGTPTAAGPYSFTVTATAGNTCAGSTNYTLWINCPTITLPATTLADGMYGSAYSATQLTPSGGTAPYTFTVTGLPSGMTRMPSAGNSSTSLTLSGTPTQAGNFTVLVTATDAYGCASGQQSYALKINQAPLTVTVNNAWRNQGEANPPFSGSITGLKNGDVITASYSTSATTSSPAGTYPITATLNDPNNRLSNYNVMNNLGTLTVANNCGITLNPATLATASLAIPYAQAFSASQSGTYSITNVNGTLPPGLQLVNQSSVYSLQGTPTTPGTYSFTMQAVKSGSSCFSVRNYTMTIAPTVVPKVTCKVVNANGSYTVWFGYENSTGAVVTIPVGANNYFTSGAQNRGQTSVFQPGIVNNAFSVAFANAGAFTSWNLKGPDGQLRGVVPSVLLPNCP
jgi:hypothetical protein